MGLLDGIRVVSEKLVSRLTAQRRMSHFKCGDCDESERCGRLPTEDCIERTAQIERDGDKSNPRPLRGYQASY